MKPLFVSFLCALMAISCKKKEEDSCSSCLVGGGTEPTGFYYAKNSGATIKADSAFFILLQKPSLLIIKG